ncbi:MAG TPA: hypothetical protein VED40_21600 [Azospirillaceae bacterium]|nr:hypothetical protein [Azospirillaceae bacterium]
MTTSLQHQIHAPRGPMADNGGAERTAGHASASGAGAEARVQKDPKEARRDEGMSFWDFVDIINPLQHIPVVNTIYREITGDTIKPAAKLAGAAILGGPIGLALAAGDVMIEESTGASIGGHVIAMLKGDRRGEPVPMEPETMVAGAAPDQPRRAQPVALQPAPVPPAGQPVPASLAAASPGAALGPVELSQAADAALAALAASPSGALPGGKPLGGTPPAAEPYALSKTQSDALEALAQRSQTTGSLPRGQTKGMGLDKYRALASAGGGEVREQPRVPAAIEQTVQRDRAAQIARMRPAPPPVSLAHPSLLQSAAEEAAGFPAPAKAEPPKDAAAERSREPVAPPPVPKEQVAQRMMHAMDKYQAQMRARGENVVIPPGLVPQAMGMAPGMGAQPLAR